MFTYILWTLQGLLISIPVFCVCIALACCVNKILSVNVSCLTLMEQCMCNVVAPNARGEPSSTIMIPTHNKLLSTL